MYEDYTVDYTIPQALRAFGFPTYFDGIEPAPIGAGGYEWVVSLPDYIANKLKSEFDDKVIIGPANGFGLYFSKDGLISNGINEIFGFSGGTGLLADKWLSLGLRSNFRFYFSRNRMNELARWSGNPVVPLWFRLEIGSSTRCI
jgi:hypothetical protein